MPEINAQGARVMGPPPFPQGGRLPGSKQAVLANHQKQGREESDYCQGRDEQGNKRFSVCCQALHISLFFDGTNNNNDNDTKAGHPTNIAKLFHASYQLQDAIKNGYFSFYMPGVGTPFPEIGEFEYSEDGLKFATGGEDRINWALVQVASAISYAINKKLIGRDEAKAKVERMSTLKAPLMSRFGPGNRRAAMRELLEPLRARVQQAQPRPLAIKLFVYGFSRGAAEARTFVNWLAELFETPEGADKPEQSLIGLPVSVEFLGLLDTVASVGIARAAPFFSGHMDWAGGTQLLPDARRYPGFVRQCRHFVAAHEQRSCFPLDSLRNEEGLYPHGNALEVIYPGVHSDVGGGYPQGDQGKARGGTHDLLSQIVLHDLYAEAFAAGAPLQVPEAMLPECLSGDRAWRGMDPVTRDEFYIGPEVVQRFNAWRTTVTGLAAEPSDKAPWEYEARPLTQTLEQAMAEQLYWITGWRIGRYANGSYKSQPFFTEAVETDGYVAKQERADYEQQLGTARDERQKSPEAAVNFPGPPIYEPQVDKTQISEAAEEFRFDHSGEKRVQTSTTGTLVDVWLRDSIYLLNDDDEQRDWEEIRRHGEQRHVQLFSDVQGTPSQDPTLALLVAMFDDQVHDSRAWFMHDALKTREMWSGYFFYRMLYFGEHSSRRLTPMMVAGKLVGVAMIAGATVYGVRLLRGRGAGGALKGVAGGLAGAAAGVVLAGVTYQVIDKATGAALPFLPGAADLLEPTEAIGTVAAKQAQDMQQAEYVERLQRTTDYLRRTGGLVEQARAVLP